MASVTTRTARAGVALLLAALLSGCGGGARSRLPNVSASESISVQSPAFTPGGAIPSTLTCDGPDTSPPLSWSGGPPNAEYVLVMSDFDSPGGAFTHWVVYGISGNATSLPEGGIPQGAVEGRNDFGKVGYGGPCPPAGDPGHRYLFVVYGLRIGMSGSIPPGAGVDQVLETVRCCIQAKGTLQGTYDRSGG
jgi:Raf kinase inhibitor-like YbhB/YbcL family protein